MVSKVTKVARKGILIGHHIQNIEFYLRSILFDQYVISFQVGEWTPAGGLNISDKYAFSHGRPPNITLRVMSRIEHPFVMNTTAKDGNERFEVKFQ